MNFCWKVTAYITILGRMVFLFQKYASHVAKTLQDF
jgi:hypothetical protein